MPNPYHPLRNDVDAALEALEAENRRQAETEIVWLDEPRSLWQTFQEEALGIIVGILAGAALLYLAAFLRGLL